MDINPYIFRAYDIRGVYPFDINQAVVFRIALAFVQVYPQAQKIVVARDSRLSSPVLAKEVVGALVSSGREVIDIGLAPDSLFSFSIVHYGFDAGIMVTASHNSKEYNGLILNYQGMGVTKEALEKIKSITIKNSASISSSIRAGRIINFNPEKDYISYVVKNISFQRPLKIIFDTGNGAVGYLPEKVFKQLGCKVQTIFGEPDGNFPHHPPDPYIDKNLKQLKKMVLSQDADIGFAFDGDGDRVILIDSKGRRVAGDYCLLLLAKMVLRQKKGPIVHGVRISDVFLKEMEQQGIETHFSVCHHNAIIKKIKEVDAVFGGEITSHYFFPTHYYLVDDAVFSAIKLAQIVSESHDFSDYIDALPPIYASPEIFIDTPDTKKFLIIEELKKNLREEGLDFIDVDGARIQLKNGWALARASNTSPYIKLRFEGETKKDLGEVRKKAIKLFRKAGIKL